MHSREARFQHCLGLDWWDGRLVVADSYNGVAARGRSRRAARSATSAKRGFASADGAFACSEPAGVAVAGPGRLLVADTNNHRLVELLRRPAHRPHLGVRPGRTLRVPAVPPGTAGLPLQ